MARYLGPVCRLCRRERIKLFLKGERCDSIKCPVEKKKGTPGNVAIRRKALSEFGLQLREKQKVRRHYGLMEKQFRLYFKKAVRLGGATGVNLLMMLERRLDNVVYRMGFAPSRKSARQLVRHSNIRVNSKKINIPSYQIKNGDEIAIVSQFKDNPHLKEAQERLKAIGTRAWLEVDYERNTGKIIDSPKREDIDIDINENLIVELYSR